ncbi:hypothetical protein [Roseibium sp. Sym1]|uniref:hypothetical protein n=1 Tax=Roseibium sp. Sym1 TaxID=3016006 RepID=UPI0022B49210|nr:hypothetical protein [Roseibium sp. Sym1]
MNFSRAVFLINNRLRAIECQYEPNGKSTLFKTLDPTIKKDDMVVVPSGTRWDMTTAKVVDVDVEIDVDEAGAVLWIVSRIDTSTFDKNVEQEEVAIAKMKSAELRRKRDALRKSMFADHEESLKELALADMSHDDAEPAVPPPSISNN